MTAFLACALCGILFVAIGVYALCAKKPVRFWAGVQTVQIPQENAKPYNRAVGKLWCGFGVVVSMLGPAAVRAAK